LRSEREALNPARISRRTGTVLRSEGTTRAVDSSRLRYLL